MSYLFTIPLLALAFVSNAYAADYHSPRAASLGGAGHAAPLLNDAIYLNPAMIAMLPAYSVSVSHESISGPDNTEPQALVQNASIQDGTNPVFSAGIGYTRKTYGREVGFGVASRISQQYSAGVGGRFLFGSDSRNSAMDTSISGAGEPIDWLQTGFIVDNLVENVKLTNGWNQYREFTLGLKANVMKMLFLYVDPHVTPSKPGDTFGWEAGFELPLMSDLFLRGGMNKNSFQPALGGYGHGHAFGLGMAFPRISLDLAVTRTYEPARTNSLLFSVTIL
ncbi:MAG: hypothetical protein JST04_08665 [Bdellovibrionales bacterium]|nr:hypothetical protein [Bdellovibrionales bacterium]